MVSSSLGMDIAQVALRLNVTFRTLRFYEDKGLVTPVRIGTRRIYTEKNISRLELIIKGKKLGFSLEEIRALISYIPEEQTTQASSFVERLTPVAITSRLARLESQRDIIEAAIAELRAVLAKLQDTSESESCKRLA